MSLIAMQGGLLASGLTIFSPAQLLPAFWLNDDSSVTDAGSGACSQWNDISGNAAHFTQSSSGSRPLIVSGGLNSRRTIRFDGSNDRMERSQGSFFVNNSGGWVFMVVKKLATDAGTVRIMFSVPRNDGGARFTLSASASGFANRPRIAVRRLDADSAGILGASVDRGTDWYLVLAQMDYSTGRGAIYVNDELAAENASLTSTGSSSNTTGTRLSIGSDSLNGNHADVEVAELVGKTGSVLAEADRNKLFGYAAHRWGLASLLPTGHPYKDAPP